MRIGKFLAIPIVLNLLGMVIFYSVKGNAGITDYGVGSSSGLVLSIAWFIQVKSSRGASPSMFVNIILIGFLVKMILIAFCFFISHRFFIEDPMVFSISLLNYLFFMLIGEVLFYLSKPWKESNN